MKIMRKYSIDKFETNSEYYLMCTSSKNSFCLILNDDLDLNNRFCDESIYFADESIYLTKYFFQCLLRESINGILSLSSYSSVGRALGC